MKKNIKFYEKKEEKNVNKMRCDINCMRYLHLLTETTTKGQ